MGLTRIRLQLAIYFCLHRGNIREKAAREQARKTGVLRLVKRGTAANQGVPCEPAEELWTAKVVRNRRAQSYSVPHAPRAIRGDRANVPNPKECFGVVNKN